MACSFISRWASVSGLFVPIVWTERVMKFSMASFMGFPRGLRTLESNPAANLSASHGERDFTSQRVHPLRGPEDAAQRVRPGFARPHACCPG